MKRMKPLAAVVMAACISWPVAPAVHGHGGGLDRHGCHRETATGGYHCHRGSRSSGSSDLDWVGILAALVVVGGLVWWVDRREKQRRTLFEAPLPQRESPFWLEATEGGAQTIGLKWRWEW